MRDISVQVAVKNPGIPKEQQLQAWVDAALAETITDAEICVRIVDAQEIQELNKHYRNKDKPTNVLSFPYQDELTADNNIQGDIIICAQVVADEANATGNDLIAQWAHMTVHGTLHIQGYDHETDQEAAAMEQLEIAILAKLGFNNPYRSQ